MAVVVKLSVLLRKYVPGYDDETGVAVQFQEGMTIKDAAEALGIPVEKVIMVLANQRPAKIGSRIKDGDTVRLAMVFGAG